LFPGDATILKLRDFDLYDGVFAADPKEHSYEKA